MRKLTDESLMPRQELTHREMNYMYCDNHRIHPASKKAIFFIKKNTEDKRRSVDDLVSLYKHRSTSPFEFNESENYFANRNSSRPVSLNEIQWIDKLPLGHLAYLVHMIQQDSPLPTIEDFNPNEQNILQIETDKRVLADLIILNIDLALIDQPSTQVINLARKCQSQSGAVKPVLRWIERNKGIEEWLLQYQINHNLSSDLSSTPFNQNFNIEAHEKILFNSLVMGESPAVLELFHKKASSAWSQKKFRESNSHKKIQNYNIDKNTIKQLDKLCRHKGVKKNDMIENLIKNAYIEEGLDTKKPARR